ncbi:MAG TPA: indole-3-glycerol phosphate synthase TrpC [Gemmatimonadales bacterium]|nr:indole-3-glycerol phosphate synthase TrpC [Gemmatimonadales bacterium]
MNLPEEQPKGKPVSLTEILERTRRDLADRRPDYRRLEAAALAAPPPPGFAAALRGERVALVAEVKRRSPSGGSIAEHLDPAAQAAAYEEGGAAAISVLTDAPFFGGSLEDLRRVADRVARPVLRKDFILDERQVLEARASGAAAVLLLVRALRPPRLRALLRLAGDLGLEVLVEAHGEGELDAALESEARVVGVNSRDLDSFLIDTERAWRLLPRIPADRVAVAESGIAGRDDVERAAEAGADAVLVGTALSASATPAELARQLAAVGRRGR